MTPISLPVTIDPRPTGHTVECEDSEGNLCICGHSLVYKIRELDGKAPRLGNYPDRQPE